MLLFAMLSPFFFRPQHWPIATVRPQGYASDRFSFSSVIPLLLFAVRFTGRPALMLIDTDRTRRWYVRLVSVFALSAGGTLPARRGVCQNAYPCPH